LAGSLISLLFEDLFKKFNSELKRAADTALSRKCVLWVYRPVSVPCVGAVLVECGVLRIDTVRVGAFEALLF
jgi:hypothetical protein